MKTTWCLGLITTLLALLGLGFTQTGPQVTIPGLGTVEGNIAKSFVRQREFFQFRGVPFAKPPTGNRRFQAPEPMDPWSDVLPALKVGQRCPQTGIAGRGFDFWSWQNMVITEETMASDDKEDCLYLQIYTPKTGVDAKLPVIVFFHGGAFKTGSGVIYGGGRFMDEDVVLIVPHYRLGPIGFLSLHTDEIPGNAGMLDMVAAIKWVKENIMVFGGDPDRITVMGESAGGVSASMLTLSPLSKDLFQQYVSQSGSALAAWAIDSDPVNSAINLAKEVGCTDSDLTALSECLMAVDAIELTKAYDVFQDAEEKAGRTGFACSSPVIQQAGAVRFLEQDPKDILKDPSFFAKPAMFGSNKHEGTMVFAFEYDGYLKPNGLLEDKEFLKRNVTNFLMDLFEINDQGETVSSGIEKAFFGTENMGDITAMTTGMIDFTGAIFLKGPVFAAMKKNSEYANSYFYSFNYKGKNTLWSLIGVSDVPFPGGVCHANELIYLFNIPIFILTDEEKAVSSKMVKLWSNFAIYGEPNPAANPVDGVPTWPPYSTDNSYLRINTEFSIMQDYTENEYYIAAQENFP